jgi:DNA-binding response OmpR family regulator
MPRQTILVVEDDPSLRQFYRTALMLAGYDVREAADGYDALMIIDTHPPDLVVLDLMLPQVSGHVVRQDLAAQAVTRDIPVVIVTGADRVEIDALDADCVLTKPVTAEQLIQVVRQCLASPAARRRERMRPA